jgi:hypothetical protein
VAESLQELLERVNSAESLLAFTSALAKDRHDAVVRQRDNPSRPYSPDAGSWVNTSIEAFLESATAWANDTDFGLKQGLRTKNPWRLFAAFLFAGKIYE